MTKSRTRPRTRTRAPRAKGNGGRILRLALIFGTSVVLLDSLAGEKGLLATMHARQEYAALASEVAHLRTENAQLRERARRLREDPGLIEEIARRDLGLIRAGETMFVIQDLAPADRPPGTLPSPDRERLPGR